MCLSSGDFVVILDRPQPLYPFLPVFFLPVPILGVNNVVSWRYSFMLNISAFWPRKDISFDGVWCLLVNIGGQVGPQGGFMWEVQQGFCKFAMMFFLLQFSPLGFCGSGEMGSPSRWGGQLANRQELVIMLSMFMCMSSEEQAKHAMETFEQALYAVSRMYEQLAQTIAYRDKQKGAVELSCASLEEVSSFIFKLLACFPAGAARQRADNVLSTMCASAMSAFVPLLQTSFILLASEPKKDAYLMPFQVYLNRYPLPPLPHPILYHFSLYLLKFQHTCLTNFSYLPLSQMYYICVYQVFFLL